MATCRGINRRTNGRGSFWNERDKIFSSRGNVRGTKVRETMFGGSRSNRAGGEGKQGFENRKDSRWNMWEGIVLENFDMKWLWESWKIRVRSVWKWRKIRDEIGIWEGIGRIWYEKKIEKEIEWSLYKLSQIRIHIEIKGKKIIVIISLYPDFSKYEF